MQREEWREIKNAQTSCCLPLYRRSSHYPTVSINNKRPTLIWWGMSKGYRHTYIPYHVGIYCCFALDTE